MAAIIGIDLGTTNSAVAIPDLEGRPRVLAPPGERAVLPSTVTFAAGEVAVGDRADELALQRPESSYRGVKRLLGQSARAPQVIQLARTSSFAVAAAPGGDAWVRVEGRPTPPHEIAAHTLRALRRRAEDELGEPVTRAVIAVPAYFDHAQRQAVRDAGQIAGLDVVRLINEPTAAALAHGFGRGAPGTVAVFDVGGGTFDVSILRVADDLFEVLAIGGDAALGGDDWDLRIVELLVDELYAERGVDPTDSPVALAALRRAAEAAKVALSGAEVAAIAIDDLFADSSPGDPVSIRRELSRVELEELTADLCERFAPPCAAALADAGLEPGDLDAVLLVGGMTRAPAVRRRAGELLGASVAGAVEPETAVAAGAAICAAVVSGADSEATLLDVTSHSLGLRAGGRDYPAVIRRGEPLPARAWLTIEAPSDGPIALFCGEHPELGENFEIGRVAFDLGGGPIELELAVDVDSILRVSARNPASGEVRRARIRSRGGLSEGQLVHIALRDRAAAPGDEEGRG